MKIEEIVTLTTTFLVVGFIAIQIATFMRVSQESIHSSGQIIAPGELGFYSDQSCTIELTHLNWGTLEPGDQTNQTIYMRNEGSKNLKLYMRTENWNPENASDFILCSWNMEGLSISANETAETLFFLSVSEDIEGIDQFSFDIVVTLES